MTRSIYLAIAGLAYVFFFLTFLALIGFVSGSHLSPISIDRGAGSGVFWAALWDSALISLFGLQHSLMARPRFKDWWTGIVPAPLERSVFVVFASGILWVLFFFWKPIPLIVWTASSPGMIYLLWSLFGLGWLIVLASTFLINHFELFGLQQAVVFARGQAPREAVFATPFLYRLVRHPLYAGFLLAFWAAPVMTVGHLVFAGAMTVYVLIAIIYEERDLVRTFGDPYRRYQSEVRKLIPRLRG
jgi:methanethiol S-methyltransferase